MFSHTPSFVHRFRDSEKLTSMAVNPAEEQSPYICVNLAIRGWGFANRVRTIALALGIASLTKHGVYIL